jgi:hypothetical protein
MAHAHVAHVIDLDVVTLEIIYNVSQEFQKLVVTFSLLVCRITYSHTECYTFKSIVLQ